MPKRLGVLQLGLGAPQFQRKLTVAFLLRFHPGIGQQQRGLRLALLAYLLQLLFQRVDPVAQVWQAGHRRFHLLAVQHLGLNLRLQRYPLRIHCVVPALAHLLLFHQHLDLTLQLHHALEWIGEGTDAVFLLLECRQLLRGRFACAGQLGVRTVHRLLRCEGGLLGAGEGRLRLQLRAPCLLGPLHCGLDMQRTLSGVQLSLLTLHTVNLGLHTDQCLLRLQVGLQQLRHCLSGLQRLIGGLADLAGTLTQCVAFCAKLRLRQQCRIKCRLIRRLHGIKQGAAARVDLLLLAALFGGGQLECRLDAAVKGGLKQLLKDLLAVG